MLIERNLAFACVRLHIVELIIVNTFVHDDAVAKDGYPKAICNWILSAEVTEPGQMNTGVCGMNVVTDARLWLNMAEQSNQLPRGAEPAGMTVAEIIQHCRPAEQTNDEHNYMGRLARWLCLWAYYSMPDPRVRCKAIDLALKKQHKRR
jgi:hypothetical protein